MPESENAGIPTEAFAEGPQESSRQQVRREVLWLQLRRLAARGVSARKAADLLKVGYMQVRRIYADPEFRREVLRTINAVFEDADVSFEIEKKDLLSRMRDASEDAFNVLHEMLLNPQTTDNAKIRIGMGFLDRNPDTQQGVQVTHVSLDADKLRQAARVAAQLDNVIPMKKTG